MIIKKHLLLLVLLFSLDTSAQFDDLLMLGITQEFSPRFLRRYHNLYQEMKGAFQNYISDVKSTDFPNEKEQY